MKDKQYEFQRVNDTHQLELLRKVNRRDISLGWTNQVGDKFCIFLDYDILDYKIVRGDIKELQLLFELGSAFVVKSRKGYHVYFLDIINFRTLIEILCHSRCDLNYVLAPLYLMKTPSWTLRLGRKDGHKLNKHDVVYGSTMNRTSLLHAKVLNKIFGFNIDLEDNLLKSVPINIGMYVIRDKKRYEGQK